MNQRTTRYLMLLLTLTAGCAGSKPPPDVAIRYSEEIRPLVLQSVETGGDFALFYEGREKPEVPVRVFPGDAVGFRDENGRLKAIAGPFKMDLNPEVREATWKRLNYLDD